MPSMELESGKRIGAIAKTHGVVEADDSGAFTLRRGRGSKDRSNGGFLVSEAGALAVRQTQAGPAASRCFMGAPFAL